ncbi:MAG: hypothetical protein ACJ790_15340 [Myxococcaceae bacterium]
MTDAATNRRDGLLWMGILGTPLVNLIQLVSNFAIARHACKAHSLMPFWIFSGVGFGLVAVMSIFAWGAAREPLRTGIKVEHSRPRLLAMAAVGACGFSLLLSIALAVPHMFMNPCD